MAGRLDSTSVSPAEKFWFDWETSGEGRARLMWAETFRYVRAENAGSISSEALVTPRSASRRGLLKAT